MKTTKSIWTLILVLPLLILAPPLHAQITFDNSGTSGYDPSAFGQNTTASGSVSTAFGASGTSSGYVTTTFGLGCIANSYISTAWGWDAVASGTVSTAFGGSYASGNYSTAFGHGTTASGMNSTTWGYWDVVATADQTTAFGIYTAATASCATAFGYASEASGFASTAWNQGVASGYYSTAWGQSSEASGTEATAFGQNTAAAGNNSTALGFHTGAGALDSVVIGSYNLGGGNPVSWVSTDPLFEIGNGTSGYSDAMLVLKNGNTTIYGSDNELPNQTLVGSNSILTKGLGDGRYVQVQSSGDVGIGTSSPSDTFQVNSSGSQIAQFVNNSGSARVAINAASGDGSDLQYQSGGTSWFGVYTNAINTLGFYPGDGGTASIFINGGNVGIGTTSPVSPLEISTGAGGADTLTLQQTSAGSGNFYTNVTFNNTNGLIGNLAALGANYWSGGEFGPNDLAMLAGQGHSSTNLVFLTNSSGSIKFATGGYGTSNEVMRMTPAGNVGIGTTSPQSKLDVNGNTYLRGTVVVTGSTSAVLINPQGDLSMGPFVTGSAPE